MTPCQLSMLFAGLAFFAWAINDFVGLMFGFRIPSSFQWWRKWRGGRWAKLTSGWMRMSHTCVQKHDEQWKKVYCSECRYIVNHSGGNYPGSLRMCFHPSHVTLEAGSGDWYSRAWAVSSQRCREKNRHNDCPDFKSQLQRRK